MDTGVSMTFGIGQSHIICPMDTYMRGISMHMETISRLIILGVWVSSNLSFSDAAEAGDDPEAGEAP